MGTEISILCLQKLTACSYIELDQSNPRPTYIV